jgi:hypothetical protein
MFSPELVAKFQRIVTASSPAEYLSLTSDEKQQYEQWKAAVVSS